MDITETEGYKKAKKVRDSFGHIDTEHWTSDVPGMSDEQLIEKRDAQKKWLEENGEREEAETGRKIPAHKDYANLLRRYEAICDEIQERADIQLARDAQEALKKHVWDPDLK